MPTAAWLMPGQKSSQVGSPVSPERNSNRGIPRSPNISPVADHLVLYEVVLAPHYSWRARMVAYRAPQERRQPGGVRVRKTKPGVRSVLLCGLPAPRPVPTLRIETQVYLACHAAGIATLATGTDGCVCPAPT